MGARSFLVTGGVANEFYDHVDVESVCADSDITTTGVGHDEFSQVPSPRTSPSHTNLELHLGKTS